MMEEWIAEPFGKEGLTRFINQLDEEFGRDPGSLDLFEWVVEDRYHNQLMETLDLFKDRPDYLTLQREEIEWELEYLLKWFEWKEEYEKCARLVKIKETIGYNIKELL